MGGKPTLFLQPYSKAIDGAHRVKRSPISIVTTARHHGAQAKALVLAALRPG
jgi:hypothetical protein